MTVHAVVRIDDPRMNKTELAYSQLLNQRVAVGEIINWRFQEITLRLGDDLRYTPDFLVRMPNRELHLHEVKGFMRDDARVKLYAAAAQWPIFKFWLCKFVRRIGWEITEVKP